MAEMTSSARDSRLPLPPGGKMWSLISSTVFGILSWSRLMSSGFVIPCTNPEILMHSFWCSFDIPAFQLISFHEIFRRFSIPLLDVMEFYRIFDAFLLLKWKREYWSGHIGYAVILLSLLSNLLNTPPSFFLAFCLIDLDCSQFIHENTLGLGRGLREHLDLCLLSYSLVLIVLDLEYRDVPKRPLK
ncbi:hypothetical protein Tco_1148204 [Tanacetum coccineum]